MMGVQAEVGVEWKGVVQRQCLIFFCESITMFVSCSIVFSTGGFSLFTVSPSVDFCERDACWHIFGQGRASSIRGTCPCLWSYHLQQIKGSWHIIYALLKGVVFSWSQAAEHSYPLFWSNDFLLIECCWWNVKTFLFSSLQAFMQINMYSFSYAFVRFFVIWRFPQIIFENFPHLPLYSYVEWTSL